MQGKIRNIAIIAHVDHGKTTLVDSMLKQANVFRRGQVVQERVMDSDELERERGITILSKNTSLVWEGVRINIVDTPGHADFGGEVERVLSMADGALLLVDAFEGAMPQTRFVLRKAFAAGLRPLIVINKMDRAEARPREVYDEVFSLFIDLGADEEALECPVVYASSRAGWAVTNPDNEGKDLTPLFDTILAQVPAPQDDPEADLCFRVSTIDWSDFVGRIAVGRVHQGRLKVGDKVAHVVPGGQRKTSEIRGLYRFDGLNRVECREVAAGDIAALYGIEDINIGDSLVELENGVPMPSIAIDPPTMAMTFRVNDSPLAGREGQYVTSRNVKERLYRELRTNLALQVEPTDSADSLIVKGRGTLHLGILIERMRREGYEFAVARPRVITRRIAGVIQEPLEQLVVDCPEEVSGKVMELVGARKGEMIRMDNRGAYLHLEFKVPARGLVGFRTRLLNMTCGEAVMHHTFLEYGIHRGALPERTAGALVAATGGAVTTYALDQLKGRGTYFVAPGELAYAGMIVGENCREDDVLVNVCRQKKLNNIRQSNKEITEKLSPPRVMGVEESLEYVGDDELLEITPKSLRLRKAILDSKARKRSGSTVG